MNKKILVLTVVALYVGLSSSTVFAAKKKEAVSMCNAAEAARQEAAKVKMEWTTTEGLIKKGKKAIAGGKFSEAFSLCETAKFQGDASVKQAAIESANWEARAPK